MAEPLTRDGTLPVLEDAVHLLRRTPFGTVLCHAIGTVPFALAFLRYWNDITSPRTPDVTAAVEAAVLALLLVWLNCWRAVYAGRLRRLLSGTPDTPWSVHRAGRLIANQAFAASLKLLGWPLALLSIFPLASTVSLYRNVAVLGDREDLDPLQLMAKSRRLAGLLKAQSWTLLPVLIFLWLLVTLNLALLLAFLPQLVRMLTGYESVFSRSGSSYFASPLFIMLVLVLSWMVFDPFIQAVYCVRCFRTESLETGEDLRSALRSIRAAALVLVVLAGAVTMSAAVTPGELEKSVHQKMQAHEYDWRLPPPTSGAEKNSWITVAAGRIVAALKAAGHAVSEAIRSFLKWFFGSNLPEGQSGAPPTKGLHWSVYLLMGAVVLAALWVAWLKRRSLGAKRKVAAGPSATAVRLDDEDLTPDRLPEESWMELAEQCVRDHDFRLALRALYLANLAWLGRREYLTIHSGKTNHEYEIELRRRARSFAEARTLFAANVAAFERVWYGKHAVGLEDIEPFRGRIDELKRILGAPQGVAA